MTLRLEAVDYPLMNALSWLRCLRPCCYVLGLTLLYSSMLGYKVIRACRFVSFLNAMFVGEILDVTYIELGRSSEVSRSSLELGYCDEGRLTRF